MKTELILIAIVAMAASLSAYAQDAREDLNRSAAGQVAPRDWSAPVDDLAEQGYQQGLCTVALYKH
jgi:hypothetical protein